MTRVAIVGGGASGLMAAIEAAQGGAQVTIFEADERVGKKILVTGNGRCNLSNADIMSSDYNQPAFVQAAMNVLPPEEVQLIFSDMGLLAFEEEEGRIYPYSNKAATVLDLLRLAASELGVGERCNAPVAAVEPLESGAWMVRLASGAAEAFDAVVVAAGGNPSRGLVPRDVEFIPCRPVLVGLKTDTTNIKGLSGIRVRARLYLDEEPVDLKDAWLDVVDPEYSFDYRGIEERGELLFRDYGVSGIAVFNMSRHVYAGQMLFIDLLPDMEPQDKVDFIWGQALEHPTRTAEQIVAGMLPRLVARAVIAAAGLNPDEPLVAEEEATVIAMVSESFGVEVKDISDPKQAQVMRGGFAVDQFNPATMECVAHPGLFVCGEALDVDGRCGGYNLNWAWTSGMLAGRGAALTHEHALPVGALPAALPIERSSRQASAERDSRDGKLAESKGKAQNGRADSARHGDRPGKRGGEKAGSREGRASRGGKPERPVSGGQGDKPEQSGSGSQGGKRPRPRLSLS